MAIENMQYGGTSGKYQERYGFGIDIGGTSIKFGLFRNDGAPIEKWSVPTPTADSGRELLPTIESECRKEMTVCGLQTGQMAGVGLGVPGEVSGNGYVAPCSNLNGWGGFNVGEELSAKLGVPVHVLNDANAAAVGEMTMGAGTENMVFVTLGTGVGGGIIVDGKLLEGAHGAGGEIGHIKINPQETERCGCGGCGCLEQYASATAIMRAAARRIAQDDTPTALRDCETLQAKDIFDCAMRGDAVSQELVMQLCDSLGRGLASIACVCDPEVIVLGGGLSGAGEYLLQAVQRAYQYYAFSRTKEARFALAKLGSDAGMYGCACLALKESAALRRNSQL